jgi:hypothetical protein
VHKVAAKPLPAQEAEKDDMLGSLVLARIASARSGLDKGVIAADLAVFAGPQMPASQWRKRVEGAIERLLSAGLIVTGPGGLVATAGGSAAAARFLGTPGKGAPAWEQACNVWLIAKALGVRKAPARRLAALATADGLRSAILVHAYGLSFKGEATPARLRHALAAAALKRAFGSQGANKSTANLAGKLGLSARASRLLAAQLMDKPREPGTDRRLVAALAVQACGATSAELPALRAAVLRRFLAVTQSSQGAGAVELRRDASRNVPSPVAPEGRTRNVGEGQGGEQFQTSKVGSPPTPYPSPQGGGESGRARGGPAAPLPATPRAAPTSAARPLDLPGFAMEVRRCAAGEAQGWAGDRKAYISRVWRSLRQRRPDWGLSEIEFKGMLAEAHRLGQLALANADLKDASNIKDVQDSALIYKNAVFHFIRVDA